MNEKTIALALSSEPVANDPGLISRRHVGFPLMALLFASGVSALLIALRIAMVHRWGYFSLAWNLFLAWLPLVFALAVHRRHQRGERNGWRLYTLALLWLIFLPNAPYIFTELIHLFTRFFPHFWPDLIVVLLIAFTGFLLGFLSLYLMQSVVAERWGRAAGWIFTIGATALCSCGIYLGRFLRWNSWDVLVHPLGLTHDIGYLAAHPLARPHSLAFLGLFATFLFLGYLMLYALTHLQPLPRCEATAA